MDKTEFIQRMSTLPTESDEFIETYIKKIYECSSIMNEGEWYNLRYQGNDIDVVKRLFLNFCRIYFPEFVIDDSNKTVINYLLHMSIYNTAKPGIIIRGNVGSGKTILVLIYIHFIQRVFHNKNTCRFYNPVNITSDYMIKGFEIFNRDNGNILVIDDMGINTESTHYGNKVNVIENVIYTRYDQFKLNPELQIICTTNLTYKDMTDLYGERVMSRLNEMAEWNDGILIGDDRRKKKALKIWPQNNYLNNSLMMP